MRTVTKRMIINVHFNNRLIWIVIVAFIGVATGIAIADEKWLYLGLAASPLIIWLSIEKPFIFPFGVYVFLIPFDKVLTMYDIGAGATITKFLGLLTLVVLAIKGAIEHKIVKLKTVSILWLFLVMYAGLSLSWSIEPQNTLFSMQTLGGLVLLYLVASSYKIQKCEFELLEWFILAGGVLAAVFVIYKSQLTGRLPRQDLISYGEKTMSAGEFSACLLIPISISIRMLLQQKSKIMKCLLGVMLSGMLYVMLIAVSRATMLGVGVIIIVYILSIKQRISFGVVLVVFGVIVLSLAPVYTEVAIERWGKHTIESGGSGRLDIWYIGWKSLEKYWLFGAGYSNFPFAFHEYIGYSSDPDISGYYNSHNIYLKIYVELGIIGIALFGLLLWKHYKEINSRVVRHDYYRIMLKGLFWAFIIGGIFRNSFTEKSFWLFWMLIMMYENIPKDESTKQYSHNHRADSFSVNNIE